MATSGVTTGIMTVRDVLTEAAALSAAKLVNEGQPTLNPFDFQRGMVHLNLLLKAAQNDGCAAHLLEEITMTWPADQAEQELDVKYLDIYEMRVRDSSDQDRQLTRIETDEYREIPNKFQLGEPISFSPGKSVETLIVRLWPVPSADTDLYATAKRVVEDITSLDENLDIPQEWSSAIIHKMAVSYDRLKGFSGTAAALELRQEAERLYQLAKCADEPQSLFLSPACR
jgi:hypothetical protein